MSVLCRVGNVDFCMHFGDVICTCLHSKYWRLHCHVQLLALAARHFGIGRQKKCRTNRIFSPPMLFRRPGTSE